MKKLLNFLFIICLTVSANAQNQAKILSDNGVGLKAIEDVLPGGQILHIRVNNLWTSLQDTESLALTFISKEMLPPDMRSQLDHKNPLLEMLGMSAFGQPLSPEFLGNFTGIDIHRPLSLSLFPNSESLFILAVPVKNFEAFTNMFANVVKARKMSEVKGEDYSGTHISSLNPNLPKEFFITCSKDYAYICSSEFLMANIHRQNMPRMSASPIIKKSISQNKEKDLLTIVDLQFIKLFIRNFKQYEKIPPQFLASGRQQFNRILNPQMRLRLMWQFGITDMNKALDYFESFLNAGYETAFKYLYERISNFDGFNMALNIGEIQQGLHISVFSKDITEAVSTLNMDEMTELLTAIPGDRNSFTLKAQTEKVKKSENETIFLDKLKAQFAEKGLDMKIHKLFQTYFNRSLPVQSLSSKVPWSLSFPYNDVSIQNSPVNLEESAKYLFTKLTTDSEMRVFSTSPEAFSDHYENEAKTLNENNEAFSVLKAYFNLDSEYILHENRVNKSKKAKLDTLTLESAYKTKDFGLFGYDEHEFINRRYFYYKKIGELLFVESHKAGNWLQETERLQKRLLTRAVQNLLNQVPEKSTYIQINRNLQDLDKLLSGLTLLENGLRDEVDQYLNKVNNILAGQMDGNEKMSKIEALPMPLTVLSLNYNRESNKCSARLLGKLEYPRPLFMSRISPLFQEYLKNKDNVGGSLVYETQVKGQYSINLIQRTDGIASLVKTAVQTFLKTHTPNSFKESISGATDGYVDTESILILNPLWGWTLN